MTVDTIFLCFCEDCESNDGISRPYYMSRGLMEFVQNSKKALSIADKSSGGTRQSVRDGKAWMGASAKPNGGGSPATAQQRATAISETVD